MGKEKLFLKWSTVKDQKYFHKFYFTIDFSAFWCLLEIIFGTSVTDYTNFGTDRNLYK